MKSIENGKIKGAHTRKAQCRHKLELENVAFVYTGHTNGTTRDVRVCCSLSSSSTLGRSTVLLSEHEFPWWITAVDTTTSIRRRYF